MYFVMNPPSAEQYPSFIPPETDPTEWDIPVPDWVSNSKPDQNQGDYGIYFELEMLDYLRDLQDVSDEDRESVIQSYRERILTYAKNSASVEEKEIIGRKFLESLDTAHGFYDFRDLVAARLVVSYGVDWIFIGEFTRLLSRYKDVNPGLDLWIHRLMNTTDPEALEKIVYTDFGPIHIWHD